MNHIKTVKLGYPFYSKNEILTLNTNYYELNVKHVSNSSNLKKLVILHLMITLPLIISPLIIKPEIAAALEPTVAITPIYGRRERWSMLIAGWFVSDRLGSWLLLPPRYSTVLGYIYGLAWSAFLK